MQTPSERLPTWDDIEEMLYHEWVEEQVLLAVWVRPQLDALVCQVAQRELQGDRERGALVFVPGDQQGTAHHAVHVDRDVREADLLRLAEGRRIDSGKPPHLELAHEDDLVPAQGPVELPGPGR